MKNQSDIRQVNHISTWYQNWIRSDPTLEEISDISEQTLTSASCNRHTGAYPTLTEATANTVRVFGTSWNCMLLCFQLIELHNFGHCSLYMAMAAGEVWFINASLTAAAFISVCARGFWIRGHKKSCFVVVCIVICHLHLDCPQSSLCSLWSSKAEWPFVLDRHH